MHSASLKLCEDQALINQQTLLEALAKALDFPAYFGHNWDAAWDALSELEWAQQAICLELDVRAKQVCEKDLTIFIELLDEAREYWLNQGQCLQLKVIR